MRAARFCPDCGDPIKSRRTRFLPFSLLCATCAPGHRLARFALFLALALLVAIVFVIGRITAPREPFYFIGTPLDVNSIRHSINRNEASPTSESVNAPLARQAAVSSPAVETICGAPTKSGRPCRRKVKGGGYCWQHRDKLKK